MTLRTRTVDMIFDGLELVAAIYDWVRNLRRPEQPIPLTHKDAERQAAASRNAGHEAVPKAPRVPRI